MTVQHILQTVSQLEEQIAEHTENLELMQIDGYTPKEIATQRRMITELRRQLDLHKEVVQCLKEAFKEIVKAL